MLDKNTLATLNVLNKICVDETYKVVDYDNLINKLPRRIKVSNYSLNQNLEYLKTGGYIDVKYSENNTYCLSVLPKGRIVLEDGTREKKSLSRYNKLLLLTTFTSGIMAFLGAFLATMIFG